MSAPLQWPQAATRDRKIASQTQEGRGPWVFIATITGILILTFGGYNIVRKYEHIAIDPAHMGETLLRLDLSSASRIDVEGAEALQGSTWITTQPVSVVRVRIDRGDVDALAQPPLFNALWETRLTVNSKETKCKLAEFAYQTAEGRILQPKQKQSLQLSILTKMAEQRLVVHANHEMRPREPGSLRVQLHCPKGTKLEWHGTRLLESRHAWNAAAHVSSKPLFPQTPE